MVVENSGKCSSVSNGLDGSVELLFYFLGVMVGSLPAMNSRIVLERSE